MAEIINPKMINTKEEAVKAAQNIIKSSKDKADQRRFELEKALKQIAELSPADGGFEEVAVMLSLPDEHFTMLAPIFLKELEKNYHNINDQLSMVQAMNIAGLHAEDARNEFINICRTIDEQLGDTLSFPKRDFLKQMLGMTYNALAEAEGVAKKTILIPLEYCHLDAKMPAYAHLTDSGMDVYALEDITIAPGETKLIPTGLKVAIPSGYELQVRPKSGRCLKTKLRIANTPGTIDAGYRDEIGIIVDNIEPYIKEAKMSENGLLYEVSFGSSYTIGKGEKFAQLVLCEVPKAVFYEVEHVSEIANDGRNGGFGSSGLK
jgi:dUTP pyrophosphatase